MIGTLLEPIARRAMRAVLALRILAHPNITLASQHVSGVRDAATAKDNALDTAFFIRAQTSCYENAPCGEPGISITLMEAMLDLANVYKFHVSEIAGGSHSKKSRHYLGVAMDVSQINGKPVSAQNADVPGFMSRCKKLGATEVLGPGSAGHSSHVHVAWPRPR